MNMEKTLPYEKNRLQRELWNQSGVFINDRRGGYLSKKWMNIEKHNHKSRLKLIKPLVDTNGDNEAHLKHLADHSKKTYLQTERVNSIVRENDILLNKIHGIAKNGSGLNTGLEHSKSQTFPLDIERSLNSTARKLKFKEVTNVNKKLLQRINQQQSTYRLKGMGKDWEKKQKLMTSICVSGSPHTLGIFPKKTRNADLSHTRFHTENNDNKWMQTDKDNIILDKDADASNFEIDNSGSILPMLRRFSNAPKATRLLSQSPLRTMPLMKPKLVKPVKAAKNEMIEQLKDVSLKENRLVVYK